MISLLLIILSTRKKGSLPISISKIDYILPTENILCRGYLRIDFVSQFNIMKHKRPNIEIVEASVDLLTVSGPDATDIGADFKLL